jgi:glucuronate isomerase
MSLLHEDRLFPIDPGGRALARAIYDTVRNLPIVSPHGHVDPGWFAQNAPFADATELFIIPDHYVLRMLVSQGMTLDELGVPRVDGTVAETDRRAIWRRFAANYHLFRATPSRMWLDHVFQDLFAMTERLSEATADAYYDAINAALATEAFRPRALFDRFGIEVLATTEGALDDLAHHKAIRASGWDGRVITT